MPRMDGGGLIQRIRDLPITPIPVILVTAQNIDQSVARRLQPVGSSRSPASSTYWYIPFGPC
jgi:CheY-like chemotaxis protein